MNFVVIDKTGVGRQAKVIHFYLQILVQEQTSQCIFTCNTSSETKKKHLLRKSCFYFIVVHSVFCMGKTSVL